MPSAVPAPDGDGPAAAAHAPPSGPASMPPPPHGFAHRPPPVPRDARLIALILASMGIHDTEPQVLHMLLEFAQRYLHDVLSDALVYADHAASSSRGGPSTLSLDDVQLAIQSRLNHSFTGPPPKEMLLSLAETVNSVPLPPISERYGLRLPPPQECLTAVNFNIAPNPPPPGGSDLDSDDADEADREGGPPRRPGVADAADEGLNQSRPSAREGTVGEEDAADAEAVIDVCGPADVSMADRTPQGEQTGAPTSSAVGVKRSLEEDEDYD